MANNPSAVTPTADATGPLRRLGRYELICEIASGGMATVHLARVVAAAGFERVVAVKCCHPHLRIEEEFTTMFLDEARLAARIYHPNVVATLDMSDGGDGELYLVMEHIEGGNLLALLREASRVRGRIPTEIALRIVLDMLAGLHCAHELRDDSGVSLGIVHRDVSPQNVLVGVDGVTRITDFGIAKAAARRGSTGAGKLKGKLAYMSPEQYGEGAVTRQSDVFAAGVVMWEVLAGARLFAATTDAQTIKNVLRGAPRPPSHTGAEIPAILDEIVMHALARDPRERFATAAEVSDAIENAGLPVASNRSVGKYVETLLAESIDTRRRLVRSLHESGYTASGATPASPATPTASIARRDAEQDTASAIPLSHLKRSVRRRHASVFGRAVVAFGSACLASFMIVRIPTHGTQRHSDESFDAPLNETTMPLLVPDFTPPIEPSSLPDAGAANDEIPPAVALEPACAPVTVLPNVEMPRLARHHRRRHRFLPLY